MHVTGRRTKLIVGRESAYVNVHARVPSPLCQEFRNAGIISWRIWIDGSVLFHAITTKDSLNETLARIKLGDLIEAEWNAMIGALIDTDLRSDVTLPLVWGMSELRQFSDYDTDLG